VPLALLLATRPAEAGPGQELLDELLAVPEVDLLRPADLSERAAAALLASGNAVSSHNVAEALLRRPGSGQREGETGSVAAKSVPPSAGLSMSSRPPRAVTRSAIPKSP
jgi:hypothetical protein